MFAAVRAVQRGDAGVVAHTPEGGFRRDHQHAPRAALANRARALHHSRRRRGRGGFGFGFGFCRGRRRRARFRRGELTRVRAEPTHGAGAVDGEDTAAIDGAGGDERGEAVGEACGSSNYGAVQGRQGIGIGPGHERGVARAGRGERGEVSPANGVVRRGGREGVAATDRPASRAGLRGIRGGRGGGRGLGMCAVRGGGWWGAWRRRRRVRRAGRRGRGAAGGRLARRGSVARGGQVSGSISGAHLRVAVVDDDAVALHRHHRRARGGAEARAEDAAPVPSQHRRGAGVGERGHDSRRDATKRPS